MAVMSRARTKYECKYECGVTYDSIDVHVFADRGPCQSVVFRRHVLRLVADRHPERPPPKRKHTL